MANDWQEVTDNPWQGKPPSHSSSLADIPDPGDTSGDEMNTRYGYIPPMMGEGPARPSNQERLTPVDGHLYGYGRSALDDGR